MLSNAVSILRRGGIVAFPTETVYGLGADALNAAAVRRAFEVKGRPATNPCIVHVADVEVARRCVLNWPDVADLLARKFWPGPLTLVLPRAGNIPDVVTAGNSSVGVRCPDHPVAIDLLREFDGPIVGPSANRSTHISPTTAAHVREELGDQIDLILDGGRCRVGIESTVLDLSGPTPTVLRLGAVSIDKLREIVGEVRVKTVLADGSRAMSSPGQSAVHYAPRSPALRVRDAQTIVKWVSENKNRTAAALLMSWQIPESHNLKQIRLPENAIEYAAGLYAALREADAIGADVILIESPPDLPAWAAVNDRLHRASRSSESREK